MTTRLGRNEPTLTRVAGGDINDAYEARWPGGDRLFIKTRKGLAGDAYRTEADGLRWLAEARALRIPKVVAQSGPEDPIAFLALEHMARTAPALDHDDRLGDGLAALHAAGAPGFGYVDDNWIGSLPQSNRTHERGPRSTRRSACCRWSAVPSTAARRRRHGPRSPIGSPPGCPSSPALPSRRRGCTAICGAATSSPTAAASRC